MRVTAQEKVEVLRQGWHEVPLRLSDAAILRSELAGKPARIVYRPQGHMLLLEKTRDGPQQFELQLEYAKAFTKAPEKNNVAFHAPQAPVNRWTIRIPKSGVKVEIHPLIAATEAPPSEPAGLAPRTDNPDETVVLAFVGAAPEVRIQWNPKAEGASGLAALASVQAEQEVTIDEGVIRTLARLDYDISRVEVTQLEVHVPTDHKVVNVFDPNVRQWEVQPRGDEVTITATVVSATLAKRLIKLLTLACVLVAIYNFLKMFRRFAQATQTAVA